MEISSKNPKSTFYIIQGTPMSLRFWCKLSIQRGEEKLPSIAMLKTLDVVKMLGDCLCISIPRRKSHFKQNMKKVSPGNYCSHTGMAKFL